MENKKYWLWGLVAFVIIAAIIWATQSGPKKEQATVRIGALLPLTGGFASYGEDVKNGLELAVEDIERNTGMHIDLIVEDNASDAKLAAQAASKLINIDHVPIVIGGPGSTTNLAVAPLMEQGKVIYFVISSTPKLNDAGDFVFKLHPDIQNEVRKMVGFLSGHQFKNIAVLYDSTSDTLTTGKDAFAAQASQVGVTVSATESFDGKTGTDFRTQIAKLTESHPDGVYILGNDKTVGQIVKQIRESGSTVPIFGWSALEGEPMLKAASGAAEGMVITAFPFSCISSAIELQLYCQAYEKKFSGRAPIQYGAHAYDALQILTRAIQDPKFSNLESAETRTALARVLVGTQHYMGLSGDITFDAKGNVTDKDFVFRVVKDGKFTELK